MEIKGKRRAGTLVFLLLVLFVCILCAVSAAGIDQSIPGVTIVPLLVGRCQLEIYDRTAQPVFTIAAACRGIDTIRLWPLPVQYPWFEDPILPPRPDAGGIAVVLP